MKRIKVGVIPAAGKGNRINDLPLTKILPKSMLPILNKPILEYIVSEMKDLKVETIYMIVGHKREIIQKYFEDGKDFGLNIKYIEQKNPRGIAHAISLTKDLINKPFMVVLGDDFTITKSFKNLVEDFFKKKAWAVTAVVKDDDPQSLKRTNCVHLDKDGEVTKMIEKPEKPNSKIRGCGVYVFGPIVFDYIERTPLSKRGLKEITDTLDLMAKERNVYGSFIDGVNININTLDDLIKAMNYALRFKS